MTKTLKELKRLRREATEACHFRGHLISWGYSHFNGKKAQQCGECVHCKKTVVIDTWPAPNGIDIGGRAVALGCNDEEGR